MPYLLDRDSRFSFFFGVGMNFYMEVFINNVSYQRVVILYHDPTFDLILYHTPKLQASCSRVRAAAQLLFLVFLSQNFRLDEATLLNI